jgi:hypothetical protein
MTCVAGRRGLLSWGVSRPLVTAILRWRVAPMWPRSGIAAGTAGEEELGRYLAVWAPACVEGESGPR